MKKLTVNEEIFLVAIFRLGEDAYGVRIREMIKELTGETLLFGTIYNTLEYLLRKNYVVSRKGESTSRRGGNKKVYYTLTNDGKMALDRARDLKNRLWEGIPEAVLKTD
ncbi:MAG: PadR family transcriptional regulator [bacterium]|nr:PadR family transcriptional regulator [bacterium]